MTEDQKPRTIATLLYYKRKETGVSLREMARELDISPSLLSQIEAGRKFPSEPIVSKLSKKLKIDPDDLRKFDVRGYLEDLKHLIIEYPELGFAIHDLVSQISAGEIQVDEAIALLSSTTKKR